MSSICMKIIRDVARVYFVPRNSKFDHVNCMIVIWDVKRVCCMIY